MRVQRIAQELVAAPLVDVEGAVRNALEVLPSDLRGKSVAITSGSRGIANIAAITRAVGEGLKARGAAPFVVPCMGSHNGATAAGQRAMIESLGITEDAMAMPIRASMDVVSLGRVSTGEVFMDRHCHEADGVVVLNRVKLHTCFAGPVQSGLTKMMVVGMGKIRSAETFHNAGPEGMRHMLLEMGALVVASGKILGGIAILEDGHDATAEIHGVAPDAILAREPALLERHRHYFPGLPLDDVPVLVVESIGKTFSGTGMDTNVTGRRPDLERPRVGILAALELAPASQGNAIGVGLADFITRRLRDAIDEHKTLLNVLTTGDMSRGKIPATCEHDRALVDLVAKRFGESGWMFIPNTLDLRTLYVSTDMVERLPSHCVAEGEPISLPFAGHELRFNWRGSG